MGGDRDETDAMCKVPENGDNNANNKPYENEEKNSKTKQPSLFQLKEMIWKCVTRGKAKQLQKFLAELSTHHSFNSILNSLNEDYDEDGGNLVIHCVKSGQDKGASFGGKDHWACVNILVQNGLDINSVDKAHRTPLAWAVIYRYSNYVAKLLKMGADIFMADHDGFTPFQHAVQRGYKDIVAILLDHDAKVINDADGQGVPPLVSVVKIGNADVCQLLLEKGADINIVEEDTNRSAAFYAITLKHLDILEILLKYKPSLEIIDFEGHSLLHLCCESADVRYFQKTINHCPQFCKTLMDVATVDNKTSVIVACEHGNSAQLKYLLDEGASITNVDVQGKTALHYCADNLEILCAELLLVKDMSIVDVKDEQGYTALALAVLVGNVSFIKLLLDKGADIHTEDNEGHKLAHWAAVCGHLKVLDILIQHNANLSSPDSHHAYPIHYAAQMNNTNSGNSESRISEKVLRKFLDCQVKLDVVDDADRQPLLWAACSGNAESCKLLLKAGADINSWDKDGLTALHCAASRGHYECIEVLRRNGADVNLMDKNKCTPLFYSITLGNKDCTRALINAKADVSHVDDRGRNPCHCAAIKGCLDTLKIIEKEKGNLWLPNQKGDYPVHEAAQKGHLDVVKYFLHQKNNKEAVNVTNKVGKTLLHIATATNNLPLIKLLINQDCDKNALMKHVGKEFTPYDLAVIKGYKEAADLLKQKGALPFSDLSNVEKLESRSLESANVEIVKEEDTIPKNDPTKNKTISSIQEEKPLKVVKHAAPVAVIPTTVEKSEAVESEKAVIGAVIPSAKVKDSPKRKDIGKIKDCPILDKAVGIDKSTTGINTDLKLEESFNIETKDAVTQKTGQIETDKATSTTSMGQAQVKETPKEHVSMDTVEPKATKSAIDEQVQVAPPKQKGHKTRLKKTDNDNSGNETDPVHVHSRQTNKGHKSCANDKNKGHKSSANDISKGHKSSANDIRNSVRNYENKRTLSRSFQQLWRAQAHTGPMHDIVMFSRMMDNYRRGVMGEEEEMDIRNYANWDGYLNDQLRFVSHIYNDDSKSPGEIQEIAKEHHKLLQTEAINRKSDTDKRCAYLEQQEELQCRRNFDIDKEIDEIANKTASMFESVKSGASTSTESAKAYNLWLREQIKRTKEERFRNKQDPKEREMLQGQLLQEESEGHEHAMHHECNERNKKWHRRKDEEMRHKLLQAYRPYFPNDVFNKKSVCLSSGRIKSASRLRMEAISSPCPRNELPSSRPASFKSEGHNSMTQYHLKGEKEQVQMTSYGLRKVKNQDRSTYANWSQKYDGHIRPRTGLVFVEPRIYNNLLKEEKVTKNRLSYVHHMTNGDIQHSDQPTNDYVVL